MKDMFKPGNDASQLSFEEMLELYKSNRNMDDVFKLNIKLFKNAAKVSSKMFGKLMDTYNLSHNKIDRTGAIPANGHDIYNYISRYSISNLQIQAVMKLDGHLDFDKLKKAVKLSLDSEPVLKCRFVEDEPPFWKPIDNIGMVEFCTLEETSDINQAVEEFIQSSMDLDKDPMVKVKLIRCEQYDVIGLKICHACCDGGGAQEYLQLLSNIYSRIDKDDGPYIPIPRIAGRKDQDKLFEELGVTNADSLFTPGSDILIPMWSFPWENGGSNTACMVVRRLPPGRVDVMSKYAKTQRATINDLVLTAFYRAMLEMGSPIYGLPLEIPVTVDLRRYLPSHKTHAIRNFSGSVNTKLSMIANEPFNETLRRVIDMMKETKKKHPGLQSALGLERIEKIRFRDTLAYYQVSPDSRKTSSYCRLYSGDRCIPTLSNLGYISRSLIKFGEKTVTDAYILPPTVRAPGILLMACSYNSVLTLAAGYYKHTTAQENVEKLLDKVSDELLRECKL